MTQETEPKADETATSDPSGESAATVPSSEEEAKPTDAQLIAEAVAKAAEAEKIALTAQATKAAKAAERKAEKEKAQKLLDADLPITHPDGSTEPPSPPPSAEPNNTPIPLPLYPTAVKAIHALKFAFNGQVLQLAKDQVVFDPVQIKFLIDSKMAVTEVTQNVDYQVCPRCQHVFS